MTKIRGKGDQSRGTLSRGMTGELRGHVLERRLDPDNHRSPARCRAEDHFRPTHPFIFGKQVEFRAELRPDETVAAGANAEVRLAPEIFSVHLVARGKGSLKNRKDSSKHPSFRCCSDEGSSQTPPAERVA